MSLIFSAIFSKSSEEADEDENEDEHDDDHIVCECKSFFVISSKSSEADEDEPDDEATWDWRSVVVPASTDKVCCKKLSRNSYHDCKFNCIHLDSRYQVLPTAFNRTSPFADIIVYNRVPKYLMSLDSMNFQWTLFFLGVLQPLWSPSSSCSVEGTTLAPSPPGSFSSGNRQ